MNHYGNFSNKLVSLILVLISLIFLAQPVCASPLLDRLQQYPQWQNKPPVKVARGDLHYPQWMSGTWQAESTLIEQIAPLAPEIVTPGFRDNQQYLNQPVNFLVRFGEKYLIPEKKLWGNFPKKQQSNLVVADRVFNGEHIAAAYIGASNVFQVKIDPSNPNKQITLLKGDRKLSSTVTARASETPSFNRFIATELTQQLFKSPERIYLNEVETTSDYQLMTPEIIEAQQITAIYLSPQDPDYFRASDRPVALYRYQLKLQKKQFN